MPHNEFPSLVTIRPGPLGWELFFTSQRVPDFAAGRWEHLTETACYLASAKGGWVRIFSDSDSQIEAFKVLQGGAREPRGDYLRRMLTREQKAAYGTM